MKILGPDGYFPIILRRTYRRRFIDLSQTYQKEVASAKIAEEMAIRQLDRERKEWADILSKLQGYYNSGVYHQVHYYEGSLNHVHGIQVHPDPGHDSTIFYFRVSNFLLNRFSVFDAREIYTVVKIIRESVSKVLLEKLIKSVTVDKML